MCSLLPVREHLDGLTPLVLLEKVFLHPLGPYWYLHTWMLCLLLQAVVWHVLRAGLFTKLVVFGLALWGLDLCGLLSFPTAMYFLAGWAVAGAGLRFTEVFRPSGVAGLPLVVLCLFPANLDRGTLGGVAVTFFCLCFLLGTYRWLPSRVERAACFVGRNTLHGDAVPRGVRGLGRGGQHRPGVGDGPASGVAVVLREGEGGAVGRLFCK